MGDHAIGAGTEASVREFTRALLRDIDALELLIERGGIEEGVRRIGVEQELFLVRDGGEPAAIGPELLAALRDPRLTTELARFNLEANLPPRRLAGGCLRGIERELTEIIEILDREARERGARVLLTGILPALQKSDLTLESITPEPRYRALNQAVMRLRGGPQAIYMRGLDELDVTHESVMLESANTSFQVHLQVGAEELVRMYNLAQLVTPPLLAIAAGSPVLLGRRLWHETRIALFEQSVDPRSGVELARGGRSRVSFGDRWLEESVLEIFREDAARFRVLLTREQTDDPVALVRAGITPELGALTLHNGTVWRWNRPCYGVADGIAHLRIENRVLPSGPTLLDEVANGALFWGAMLGLGDRAASVSERVPFDLVQQGFLAAARIGLDASVGWFGGHAVPARELLLDEIVPAARRGLREAGVADADRYLDVIEERARTRRTAASWLLASFSALSRSGGRATAGRRLTQALLERATSGPAVHSWPPLSGDAPSLCVADVMSTDLFTIRPEDVVDLAASVMDWRRIRHVPVETTQGELVGLVSHRALLRALTLSASNGSPMAIRDVMEPLPRVVSPELSVEDAARELLQSDVSCLLVVEEGRLVGIATERDLLRALSPR